jgi:hypothetical protein
MFMRFRGGGVGHKSTREVTKCVYNDRDPLDTDNGASDFSEDSEDDLLSEVGSDSSEVEGKSEASSDVGSETTDSSLDADSESEEPNEYATYRYAEF